MHIYIHDQFRPYIHDNIKIIIYVNIINMMIF